VDLNALRRLLKDTADNILGDAEEHLQIVIDRIEVAERNLKACLREGVTLEEINSALSTVADAINTAHRLIGQVNLTKSLIKDAIGEPGAS
jgi:hypothetical protein